MPYTGTQEYFAPKISDEVLASLKDASGDIRFEKVFKWLLPRFGDDDVDFFEFLQRRRHLKSLVVDKAQSCT